MSVGEPWSSQRIVITALRNRALLALMLGHFTNDMLGGFLTLFLPEAKERFALGNGEVGLIALAYVSASSLSQPFFGWFTDRKVRRWIPAAVIVWGGTFASLYGVAGSYGTLVLFAALAGLASGAYHPLGASSAAAVAEPRTRNTALSLYTVGGTTGLAMGPLVGVIFLSSFGNRGTLALLPFTGLVAVLLYREMIHVVRQSDRGEDRSRVSPDYAGIPWAALSRVIGTVMLRSWVFLSVLQFLPVWYSDLGYGRSFYGPLATTVILAGAVGTLIGGSLADRVGERRVLLASLTLSVPPLLLIAGFPGPWAFAAGAAFGITADASLSVTLVAAQRLLPGRTGIASGVILGLGFITGGIGVPITGRLADAVGIPTALASLALLSGLATLLALTIPRGVLATGSATTSDAGDSLLEAEACITAGQTSCGSD